MEDLSKALEGLKVDGTSGSDQLNALLQMLENEDCDRDLWTKTLVDGEILPELKPRLARDENIRCKAAQMVAELAKVEDVRNPCVDSGLVPPLMDMLSGPVPEATQACRALGNICFDNDRAREAVEEQGGVQKLIELLKSVLDSSQDGADRLRTVACGFLLNVTNTHESIQEKAITLGAMEVLNQYLVKHGNDEGVAQMALLSVGSLADSEAGKDKLSECEVAVTIGNLLGNNLGSEIQDMVLELLANLAESDEVKVQLARSELKHRLITMLETCAGSSDDDSLNTVKLTSDLIVLLLTGDPSMDILYEEGKGVVFKEALKWLASHNEHLQISGALAIGNFARNDSHCLQLVAEGITELLLAILRRGGGEVGPTLQHAAFSALRNLAIPAANKSRMLECGILDVGLQYVRTDFTAVQFKLLGLLRMIVDGQESAAKTLGTSSTFLQRLEEWCRVEDHAGVKGEATRLVSWLVKHSHSTDVMKAIIRFSCVKHLVAMANAEHAVMQNEALVALTLIASSVLESAVGEFGKHELVPTIKVLLTENDTLPEIICNVLTLVRTLVPSGQMVEYLKAAEISTVLKQLSKHGDSNVQKQAKETTTILGKG